MGHREHLDRWFGELWGKRDERLIDELLAEDCVIHGLGDVQGREGFRGFFHAFCGAFRSTHIRVEECLEDGESWACRCAATLTDHSGVEHHMTGSAFGRMRGGKFVETRDQWDFLHLLESTKSIEPGGMTKLVQRETERAKGGAVAAPRSHRAFFERWFDELWGKRNRGIIDECVSETCDIIGLPDTQDGRASFHAFFTAFGAAFPEIHIQVDDCVEHGERVAVRCSGFVRDHGGTKHAFSGGALCKVRDGQMVEAWNQWDFLNVLDSMNAIEKDALSKLIRREAAKTS